MRKCLVRCTKGVVSSKPVTVKPNIAVVSKPTNVEVGPAKVEKEKFLKRGGYREIKWILGITWCSWWVSMLTQFKEDS